ncbi:MAG: hypothetical protein JST52_00570 [Bacteroidetes bacterium]|nr:hypothetical protein [Bacteroidota bacterium]MBS1739314.1 hypothetical protein [Bacteroidota bacterium]
MKGSLAFRMLGMFLLVTVAVLIAQSCSSAKGCGCGSDINKVYRAPKKYR